nr:hypothetical protein [Tanacetum cinerariifolium]
MGDEKPISTLGDYSKPSHEGYRNTIELPEGKCGNNEAIDESKYEEEKPLKEVDMTNEVERRVDDKPAKSVRENVIKNEEEEPAGVSSSHAVGYYLKHKINEKLIEGLVENQKFNDSLKEDIGGKFEIPCNIGGLKHTNALVDQGSDVNVMPLSTYNNLNDESPVKTDIRLSLDNHSHKGGQKNPFILGTPFLTTAKAVIKFNKGMITLRSGKSKISFHKIPEPYCRIEKGIKNDIEPIAPTMTINRLVIELEEKIKLHQEKGMKFDKCRIKIFNYKRPASVKEECEVKDKGGVT